MKHFWKKLRWLLLIFIIYFLLGLLIANSASNSVWVVYTLILIFVFPIYLIYMVASEIKYHVRKRKSSIAHSTTEEQIQQHDKKMVQTQHNDYTQAGNVTGYKSKPRQAPKSEIKPLVAPNMTPLGTEPARASVAKLRTSVPLKVHHLRRKLYNFVVVDTETTGLSRSEAKVIQLSAIKYHRDKPADTFNVYINPGNLPLPTNIVLKTGIQDEQLTNAPTFDDVKDKFLAFVGTLPWVGHNINSFDIPILVNNGLNLTEVSTIDTLKLSRKKLSMEHYTLENLKKYFGINHLSHNALEDCKTTAVVYQHLRDDDLTPIKKDYSGIPQTLSGLNFAVSGSFPGLSRNDIKEMIISHGGNVKSTVTHNTDYLVDGKQTSNTLTDGMHSSKELKARDYGTNILSLSELSSLIKGE